MRNEEKIDNELLKIQSVVNLMYLAIQNPEAEPKQIDLEWALIDIEDRLTAVLDELQNL